jgi:hypothetical protein
MLQSKEITLQENKKILLLFPRVPFLQNESRDLFDQVDLFLTLEFV